MAAQRNQTLPRGILYYQRALGFVLQCEGRRLVLPAEESFMDRGLVSDALRELAERAPEIPPCTVRLVLPHSMYGVDFITLPGLKRQQLEKAYQAELDSLYKNAKELSFQRVEISGGKTVTYRVVFAQSALLQQLKEGFAPLGIQIEGFVPLGSALLEGLYQNKHEARRGAALLLALGEGYSYLAAAGQETLLGGLEIPFGAEALSDSRVIPERRLLSREASELLVINARERAKSTRLTMAINLEEEIDDSIPDDEQLEPEPALPDLTHLGEEGAEGEDEDEPEIENAPLLPSIKVLKRKAIRVLPKFMRREEPTQAEGFLAENFRMFERRVLLLLREMGLVSYYPKAECVFILGGAELAPVVEQLRREHREVKWELLELSLEEAVFRGAGSVSGGKLPVF